MILIKKEKESAKLRMGGGSWTINLDKYDLSKYEEIQYITPKCTYRISRADAVEHGFTRYLGGENKLVVPVKHWRMS